jgi:putative ABC transport system permease protein
MMSDVRLALRSLARSPGYLAAAVVTIGLAMGANSAIFGAVYAVLLKPLPIRDPERLVIGWETNPSRNQAVVEVSYRNFEAWQSSNRTLAHAAVFGSSAWSLSLEDRGDPVRLASVGVSTTFFDTLDARPFLGRFFQPEDESPHPTRPLVLSHRLWQTRFGADPTVIGTTVLTSDGAARIVGVAPADLDFPRGVDVWLPVRPVLATVSGIDGFRDIGVLFVVARLRDGVSTATAAADLERIAADSTALGGLRFGTAVHLTAFLDYQLGPVRAALWWLWGAVIVLLLVACGNVAALMVARAVERKREHVVRLALGATTAALWRSSVLESLIVLLAGGVAGLLFAHWVLAAIIALAPDDVPRLAETSVNVPVVAFTFALSLAAALIIACAPILYSRRLSLVTDLKDRAHGTAGGGAPRVRTILLGAQVALSVVLTTAAGLMLRSYVNVRQLDLGFVPDQVATLEMDSGMAGSAYNEWARELIARVEELPAVESAGAVNVRPLALGAIGSDSTIVLEGQPNTRQSSRLNPLLNYLSATPGYFTTMRIRLTQGRFFDAQDHSRSQRVAIVSESTARRLWPGQNPIGRRLSLLAFSDGEPAESWRTVVGVVNDVRYRGLDDVRLDVYEPAAQSSARAGHLVVRSSRDAVAVAAAVRAEARRMEPRTIISGITSMRAVVDRAAATWTLSVWMFGLFAIAAVVLVCVGVFSSVSLDAMRRSKEFALRIALGARSRDIAQTALASTGVDVLGGAVFGMILAIIGSRAMTRLLFGVGPLDVSIYVGVVCLTALTIAIGCVLPLYRTTRIDPASALRRD